MKFTIMILSGLAAKTVYAGVFERAVCNANNCLRQVSGTDPGIKPARTSRLADCSSFQKVTVTPAPSTTTITTTITTTLAPAMKRGDDVLAIRQVTITPTGLPAYAVQYCTSSVAYASACSCAGITKTTTTAATPTVTEYATATATVCPGTNTICSGTCKNLQTDGNNCGSCGNSCSADHTCTQGVCAYDGAKCSNVYTCDYRSLCTGAGGCSGFCQPDASGQGRCREDDNNNNCNTQTQCSSNLDCMGGQGVCQNTCCGFFSCFYPSTVAGQGFCENVVATKRLFRKSPNVVAGADSPNPLPPSS